jgi:hypothetical protein
LGRSSDFRFRESGVFNTFPARVRQWLPSKRRLKMEMLAQLRPVTAARPWRIFTAFPHRARKLDAVASREKHLVETLWRPSGGEYTDSGFGEVRQETNARSTRVCLNPEANRRLTGSTRARYIPRFARGAIDGARRLPVHVGRWPIGRNHLPALPLEIPMSSNAFLPTFLASRKQLSIAAALLAS